MKRSSSSRARVCGRVFWHCLACVCFLSSPPTSTSHTDPPQAEAQLFTSICRKSTSDCLLSSCSRHEKDFFKDAIRMLFKHDGTINTACGQISSVIIIWRHELKTLLSTFTKMWHAGEQERTRTTTSRRHADKRRGPEPDSDALIRDLATCSLLNRDQNKGKHIMPVQCPEQGVLVD